MYEDNSTLTVDSIHSGKNECTTNPIRVEADTEGKENRKKKSRKKAPRFFAFFSKWFWIGCAIIVAALVLELLFDSNTSTPTGLQKYLEVLIPDILRTVGIAFMLGAIFDFSKNTEGFVSIISKILSDVVVDKSFLSKLEENGKKDALSLILRPTENQVTQYARIGDYFDGRINKSIKMWETNFKTNMVIIVEAKIINSKVVVEGKLSHRIYKVQDRYEDIDTVFERSGSNVSNTRILYPGGSELIDEGEPRLESTTGICYTKYKFKIPEKLYVYPFLTIERDVYEPGFDHWTNFHWTSLTPYDGLVFSLRCFDNLTIKEHIIFDEKSLYNVSISEDKREIRIISTDWLEANTGFSITIGDP